MENDSFKVIEEDDGSFTISWDENDPKWMFLNNLTEDQVKNIVTEAISRALEDLTDNEQPN